MSELGQVLDKLGAIEEQNNSMTGKLDELLQWKSGVEERCKAHREKTDELRAEIFSEEGIKSKVQRLWNCKGALRDKVALWQDFGMYVLKAVVVACLLAAIWFFMGLYKKSG